MFSVSLKITGKVQGVAFRYMTKILADEMGICGKVLNKSDGSVFVEAQGDKNTVDRFVKAMHLSPAPMGRVDTCSVQVEPNMKQYKNFYISYE